MATRWPAIAIACLYLLLGAAYAFRTPVWQAPDEPAHFNYVRHVAEGRGLPVLEPGAYDRAYLDQLTSARFPEHLAVDSLTYEAHQPPLYYVLAAPVAALLSRLWSGEPVHGLRLTSLVMGLAVLGLAWRTGRAIFPGDPAAATGMLAFTALVPQHVAVLSAVSNDVLAGAVSTALLLVSIRVFRDGPPDPRLSMLTGVVVGAALVTKTTAYGAAALPLIAGLLAARRGVPVAGALAVVYAIGLALGAAWWTRNMAVYGAIDLLGLARHAEVVAGQPLVEQWSATMVREALVTVFQSFWLQLGWMAAPAEPWVYHVLGALTGVVAAGAAPGLWRVFHGTDGQSARTESGAAVPVAAKGPAARTTREALVLSLALLSLVIVQAAAYNLQFLQPQGRYLFPAIAPIALLAVLGIKELAPVRWFPTTLGIVSGGLVALNLYAHAVVIPTLSPL